MDGEKINIVYQDGKEEEVDVVTYLNSKDSMNQYLVYTKMKNNLMGILLSTSLNLLKKMVKNN